MKYNLEITPRIGNIINNALQIAIAEAREHMEEGPKVMRFVEDCEWLRGLMLRKFTAAGAVHNATLDWIEGIDERI